MAGEILFPHAASASITITIASLANATANVSAVIDNTSTKHYGAKIGLKIKSGAAAPTANSLIRCYLYEANKTSSPDYNTDGWTGAATSVTILNAQIIGAVKVSANATTTFYSVIDTGVLGRPLPPVWGIALYNDCGQTLDSTAGSHSAVYTYYDPQVQA